MRGRGERGNSILEFALGFTVLWLMFSGVYEYGYSMFTYNNLTTLVRTGARFAARMEFEEPGDKFAEKVKNLVVFGDPDPGEGAVPLAPRLSTDKVTVSWTRDAGGKPDTVTVALRGYQLNAMFQTLELNNRPHTTVRRAGMWKTEEGGGGTSTGDDEKGEKGKKDKGDKYDGGKKGKKDDEHGGSKKDDKDDGGKKGKKDDKDDGGKKDDKCGGGKKDDKYGGGKKGKGD